MDDHPAMATDTLPPGPTASLTRQTVQFWRRPEPYLHAARSRYGDVFTARVLPAGAVVFVADAALVKQIFAAPTDLFHAGEGNRILEPVMGARSILLLDEDEHLRRRRLMLPAFHGDAVRRLVQTMRELTAAEVDRWPVGEPFALLPRTNALTLEIILRTVFGVAEGERLDRLRALMPRVTHFPLWLMLMWVRPSWGACRRGAATSAARAGRRAAARRDRARRRAPDLDERPDVLSMLVRARDADGGSLDDRELRDQLMTLLLAGHETTATGLAWTFERVLRDPAIQERLATAVRHDDDAYLDAVVKESLRVRPVIDRVGRRTTRETEIGGHRIPADTQVAPAIGIVGLDAAHHPDPFAFRPERWLGDDAPPGSTWLPFGGGTRRCLGATFAQTEMREVIRVVVGRAQLRAEHPAPERQLGRHITIAPQQGSRVVRVA
jgi:cytochrome P450